MKEIGDSGRWTWMLNRTKKALTGVRERLITNYGSTTQNTGAGWKGRKLGEGRVLDDRVVRVGGI
jgi:hypothetical protein